MITNTANHSKLSENFNNFEIKATGAAFKILSANLYQRPIESIVRELLSNAVDAVRNNGGNIDITLPTSLNPTFVIQDYGCGMTHDELIELSTKYFSTSKDGDNTNIGGFGLGSKTPFAYTQSYTIESHKNGEHSAVSMFLTGDGAPQYMETACIDNIPNGTKYEFGVDERDFDDFYKALAKQIRFCEQTPNIVNGAVELAKELDLETAGVEDVNALIKSYAESCKEFFSDEENLFPYVMTKDGKISEGAGTLAKTLNRPTLIIKGVPYEIDFELVLDKIENKNLVEAYKDYDARRYMNYRFFTAEVGDVDLSPSREVLTYTDKTVNFLKEKIISYTKKFVEYTLKNATTHVDTYKMTSDFIEPGRSPYTLILKTSYGSRTLEDILAEKRYELEKIVNIDNDVWDDFANNMLLDKASYQVIAKSAAYDTGTNCALVTKTNEIAPMTAYKDIYKLRKIDTSSNLKVFLANIVKKVSKSTILFASDKVNLKTKNSDICHGYACNAYAAYAKNQNALIATTAFAEVLVKLGIVDKAIAIDGVTKYNNLTRKERVKNAAGVKVDEGIWAFKYNTNEKVMFDDFANYSCYRIIRNDHNFDEFVTVDMTPEAVKEIKVSELKEASKSIYSSNRGFVDMKLPKIESVLQIPFAQWKKAKGQLGIPTYDSVLAKTLDGYIAEYDKEYMGSFFNHTMNAKLGRDAAWADKWVAALPENCLLSKVIKASVEDENDKISSFLSRLGYCTNDDKTLNKLYQIRNRICDTHFSTEEIYATYPMFKFFFDNYNSPFADKYDEIDQSVVDYVKLINK